MEQESQQMNDFLEQMNAGLNESMRPIKEGEVITGTIVQIRDDEVLVDVGGKSEGIIKLSELSVRGNTHPKDLVKAGDSIRVMVLKAENDEGNILLSKRRAEQSEALEKLEKALEDKTEIAGEVIQVVKGGLLVDVGIRGFVPASQIERGYVENLDGYVGKTLRLRVIEMDKNKAKAVLSQKVILEEERNKAKQATWETLAEGQSRKGTVRRLTNFGAFVDLGGVDGLLHISEMSWGRIKHPSEVVQDGDEIEVFILKVDRSNEKISLGLKQVLVNPWEAAMTKYVAGSIVTGKVVRLTPFGAFVELEPGIDGLIHISQLADRRIAKPDDVVKVGQEVQVKVLEVKPEEKRISLSLREVQADKEKAEAQEYLANKEDEAKVTIGEALEAGQEK